jgi:hypothetical protein
LKIPGVPDQRRQFGRTVGNVERSRSGDSSAKMESVRRLMRKLHKAYQS